MWPSVLTYDHNGTPTQITVTIVIITIIMTITRDGASCPKGSNSNDNNWVTSL